MKAIDLITDLQSELNKVKAQGQAAVSLAGLEAYLAAQEPLATSDEMASAQQEQALAKARHDLEVWKVRAPLEHAGRMEMFRSALEAGQTALQSLILINGGAAVALLAFLGNILTKDGPRSFKLSVSTLNVAMLTFVIGVGLAGAAGAFRYLTQFAGASGWIKTGRTLNWLAIASGIASLVAFFVGGLRAYWAFR